MILCEEQIADSRRETASKERLQFYLLRTGELGLQARDHSTYGPEAQSSKELTMENRKG